VCQEHGALLAERAVIIRQRHARRQRISGCPVADMLFVPEPERRGQETWASSIA
jgi:hypothetical protein